MGRFFGRSMLVLTPIALVSVLLFAAEPESGKKYALLIGVKRYSDGTGLRNLEYTENDVNALAEVLTKQGYRVTVLTREASLKEDKDFLRPTAKNIRDHLAALTKVCKSDDTLLVAVTGHGAHLKTTDKLYFCPQDTDLKDEKSLLAIDDVMAAFDKSNCQAASKVLIMDACRNDPADGAGAEPPKEVKSLTRPLISDPPGGTVALFSCSKGQISHESTTFKQGFLFHHVIEGLKGKAANKKGEVTWLGLASYVGDELPEAVRKDKGPKVIQTPEALGQARNLVLARVNEIAQNEPKPGEEREFEIADGVRMRFCYIPRGQAQLGSTTAEQDYIIKTFFDGKVYIGTAAWLGAESEDSRGKYTEKVGFWLGKYHMTQEEWTAVMGTTPFVFHKNGTDADYAKRVAGLDTSRFPAESVSWDDAQKFLTKVNERPGVVKVFGKGAKFVLPHEDRWEYAYRGGKGNKTAFYWGDELNGDKANCDGTYPYGTKEKGQYVARPTEVGAYASKAPHPWGLCDMSGNVYQWCENKHSNDGESRVLRGGSWYSNPRLCRAAFRDGNAPSDRFNSVGFRVCVVLD